ncbi:MBOAT family protein [Apibacter muscae]|uniref:MBOAT family O-acyltransferase n=1 Tax=Apibacter muscae TaxID=2509004 RepID=UPI0011AD304C|nr:MBOAT family O-acyltransferase [Apibacter muscae]TWP23712.1 MBOAT family protein [Apibacter muscae]
MLPLSNEAKELNVFQKFIQNIDAHKLIEQFYFNPLEPLIFNSGFFVFIFTFFMIGYALVHRTHFPKVIYVILFSLYFYYRSSGYYYLVLIFCVFFDFFVGFVLYKAKNKIARQILLFFSLAVNLGILVHFKYTNFLIDSFNAVTHNEYKKIDIFLPVGVSFFTFQSMSYIIDIYRNKIKPVKNLLDYGFFVSFFPQLVAGPIIRAYDFIPQLYNRPTIITKSMIGRGMFLITIGLFKKSVISDYIGANFVDRIFDQPQLYSGIENLFGIYGYALQIYCDFSGYSDMAIGIALLLGFHFPKNFNSPYQAKNITEFWHRWHISLSSWLKDYLYFSLGGNRYGNFFGYFFPVLFFIGLLVWGIVGIQNQSYWQMLIAVIFIGFFSLSILLSSNKKKAVFGSFNQMTTMLLGGLWHGASMRFILWGAMHGLALAIHKTYMNIFGITEKNNKKSNIWINLLAVIITFHFVCFCWIFFRVSDMQTAWTMLGQVIYKFEPHILVQMISGYKLVFFLMLVGFILHFTPVEWEESFKTKIEKAPYLVALLFLFIVVILVAQVKSSDIQPFIYFQF